MQRLDPSVDLDSFFTRLNQARECALLLDYDGTLAPFCIERERAFPYPGVPEVLRQIAVLGNTRLVIISGRPVYQIPRLLGLGDYRLEIWGCHGWERLRPDGTYHLGVADGQALQGLARAYAELLALACGRLRGRLTLDRQVEKKPLGLALHWRGWVPERIAEVRKCVTEQWMGLVHETGLKLYEFEEGIELRVLGRTKADAVETILQESGEEVVVAYLGDGLTDEDAFRALKGRGLTVRVGTEPRPTAADLWIKPPYELLEFLWLWEELRNRPG